MCSFFQNPTKVFRKIRNKIGYCGELSINCRLNTKIFNNYRRNLMFKLPLIGLLFAKKVFDTLKVVRGANYLTSKYG